EQLDDLEDGQLGGILGEGVAALDAALGAQDAGAAQDGEKLLEELDRDVAAARELTDRDRAGATGAGELGKCADRVGRLGCDREHVSMLTRRPERRTHVGVIRAGRGGRLARRRPATDGYSQPRSVACSTAWARSTAPSLP